MFVVEFTHGTHIVPSSFSGCTPPTFRWQLYLSKSNVRMDHQPIRYCIKRINGWLH
ncbi:hypothetical protein C8R48DRAFT_683271 [Suillus tomentosus]|nr:hypothetical protein C8R48DRAFT_683271 [Suillus tomentosus]